MEQEYKVGDGVRISTSAAERGFQPNLAYAMNGDRLHWQILRRHRISDNIYYYDLIDDTGEEVYRIPQWALERYVEPVTAGRRKIRLRGKR